MSIIEGMGRFRGHLVVTLTRIMNTAYNPDVAADKTREHPAASSSCPPVAQLNPRTADAGYARRK